MTTILKADENEDDNINNLEIYIDCLKEITDEFKNNKNPNYSQREEFFNEYINLEDNILTTFDKIQLRESPKINDLIEEFNVYWNNYQDEWSEEYW